MKKTIIVITSVILFTNVFVHSQVYTLDQCIELALRNKDTVKNAALDVKLAKLGKRGSLQGILPSVSAGGSWSETNFKAAGIPSTSNQGANISINQTIFDGGAMWNSIFRASNGYVYNQQLEHQIKSRAIYDVIQAYYMVLKSQQLLDVARMNLMLANQQVELVTNQFEIGAAAKTDLLKVNVLKGQAQIQVIQRDTELQQAYRNIRNTMGLFGSNELIMLQDTVIEDIAFPDPSEAYNLMDENNPALLVKRAQIKDALLSYKLTRGAHLPSLGLNWSYNTQPVGFAGQSTAFDEYQRISVGVSIPLFTGFNLSTRTQQARISITKQEYDYATLMKDLKVQLENLLEILRNYADIIPINEEVLVSAEEDLKLVQVQYALGSVTILEVLDAQLSVTQARSSLVSTKYDAQIQAAALKALMGTLERDL